MNTPVATLIRRLSDRGFCTKEGYATSKAGWSHLDADQIILLYSSVNRGIQNYYRFADNWSRLYQIQRMLRTSLAKTLARKYQISTAKVYKRFGKEITVTLPGKEGKEDRKGSFYLNRDWARNRDGFQSGKNSDIDMVQTWRKMRTRSKLGKPCCICGEMAGQIVMHHVRHVRKLSHKREATGFNRILRAINRKQIPVCTVCHGKIHRGGYDNLKLSKLAYIPS
jgi:hypothetical protein